MNATVKGDCTSERYSEGDCTSAREHYSKGTVLVNTTVKGDCTSEHYSEVGLY